MTGPKTNPIAAGLDSALRSLAFQRKKLIWTRELPECWQVVELQKSEYGQQYYLNIGFWLKALGETESPREHKCHIRLRATLLPDGASQLGQLLDLEANPFPADEYSRRLEGAVRAVVMPLLQNCATLEGMSAEYQRRQLATALVHKAARALLGPES